MRNLLRCMGCLFLGLFLLGAAPPRQPATYQPPIGIPAPSFGIEEIAPASPAAWPATAAPGYYYIDNRHPNATDTDNPYGYPNRPRQSVPMWKFMAAIITMRISASILIAHAPNPVGCAARQGICPKSPAPLFLPSI